jgi:hypothetical protein
MHFFHGVESILLFDRPFPWFFGWMSLPLKEPGSKSVSSTCHNPVNAVLATKQTNSIAYEDWVGHQSLIFHVDLEHGGDACGVLQLSVLAWDPTGFKVIGEFDEYIKPPATALWLDHASEVHGLNPASQRIRSAMSIFEVWNRFFLLKSKVIYMMAPKRELLQPGVVNHVIASGSFKSLKTPIMVYCSCLDGAPTSWTQEDC